MSRKPSQVVAVVASLALAGCSSIGVINGQRLDVGATTDADSTPHYWHPCEDFEWACIAGVASVVVLAVLLSQHSLKTPPGRRPRFYRSAGLAGVQPSDILGTVANLPK